MASRLRTHPEADRELEEAISYLADRTLWQASRFADAYHAALDRIIARPEGCHFVWREYRRYNIPGYSHALIYRSRQDEVHLIAVMHEKRHPDYWKYRISDDQE
jgi:plasmid stabilization system protein ParE